MKIKYITNSTVNSIAFLDISIFMGKSSSAAVSLYHQAGDPLRSDLIQGRYSKVYCVRLHDLTLKGH